MEKVKHSVELDEAEVVYLVEALQYWRDSLKAQIEECPNMVTYLELKIQRTGVLQARIEALIPEEPEVFSESP